MVDIRTLKPGDLVFIKGDVKNNMALYHNKFFSIKENQLAMFLSYTKYHNATEPFWAIQFLLNNKKMLVFITSLEASDISLLNIIE